MREKLVDSQELSVKVSRSTSDRLRKHCEKNQCTMSHTVRKTLHNYLEMEAQEEAIAP